MISHLLLAVDDGTSSEAARVAGDLAELSGATVEVLHCDELGPRFEAATWLDDDTEPRTAVGNAVIALRHRGVTTRGVTTRTASTSDTAHTVLHQGLNAATDILVLGLPKVHHLGGLFVGSVAADVVARTTIPLLLVPEPPETRGSGS